MPSSAFQQPASQAIYQQGNTARKISVLVADRLEILGPAISKIIGLETDLEVVSTVHDGDTALTEAIRSKPDIVLLSMQLLKQSGASIAAEIKRELPMTRILIWGTQDSDIQEIWDCPYIDGYLPIQLTCPSLIHAIRDTTGDQLQQPPASPVSTPSSETKSQAGISGPSTHYHSRRGPPAADCVRLIIGIAVAFLLFCPILSILTTDRVEPAVPIGEMPVR